MLVADTRCVGDKCEMLVTDLTVGNPKDVNKIQVPSPTEYTNCHQLFVANFTISPTLNLPWCRLG